MIIHKALTIQLKETQIKQLKSHYRQVIRHLEEGFPLKMKVLEALKNDLSVIVNESPQWQEVLHAIHDGDDFYCIRLMHSDNEILNLPWSMAVDNKTNKQLGNIERLYLTKTIYRCFEEKGADFPKAPAPLKILIMISSPEDTEWKHRLSYEEEEYAILKAFEPLMYKGAVEVDFTEDGSLEALERKLKTNKYHILHFSGHATFREKDKTGYIRLEDPLSLKTHWVSAQDFSSAVNCHPQYKVPMVMLSSCQTAQGSIEEGLRGITNHLLKVGVPVVISMGMAVSDYYAALFSAHFYKRLAGKQTVFSAFNAAIERLRETEYNDLKNTPGSREIPLQWIIPNLYLSRDMEEVVDWNQPEETLSFSSHRYIFGQDRILLEHEKDYRFIGRRKDKAEILGPFFEKVPILLKGQGGVGKTAMAEHLAQRLIAKEPKTVPFLFDEFTRSIKEILDTLQNFLIHQGDKNVIANVNQYEKAMDKFQYLLFQVKEAHQPIFMFDNLESFQKEPGEDFAEEYSDIKEVIAYLCERQICHMILTCRYPVPGFNDLRSFDLNQVGFNDFWKKCLYIDVGFIHIYLREKASIEKARDGFLARPGVKYIDVGKLLHDTFGGNYRALEFFDSLIKENPDKIHESLDSLEKFRISSKEASDQVKNQMSQNLIFSKLMSLLSSDQQRVLELLSHFRIPVQQFALQLQIQCQPDAYSTEFKTILAALHRLTLIEITINQEIKLLYYYVSPIVKTLLDYHHEIENPYSFSHEQAGIYYYDNKQNIKVDLIILEEAFYHFYKSGNKEKVHEIGDRLSWFYYERSLYHNAFFYAQKVYQLFDNETSAFLLNILGMVYNLQGEYGQALIFFQKALIGFQKAENKKMESSTLSNVSMIYYSRGDYDISLKYLEQCLEFSRQVGDKLGEGRTLNNMSQIYYKRKDYNTALNYLKKSLRISREVGDKELEGMNLNNISQIYEALDDYSTAFKSLKQSLKINREAGNKVAEMLNLGNIGKIYKYSGDYDNALKYLEQSLKVCKDIGYKEMEGNDFIIISQIYSDCRDHESALKYAEQALRISHEIRDKSMESGSLSEIIKIYNDRGDCDNVLRYQKKILTVWQELDNKSEVGRTLSNIANTYYERSDYDTALSYLDQCLKICREIGDKPHESMTLSGISLIYLSRGDYDKAIEYLEQNLRLYQETGNKLEQIKSLNNIAEIYRKCGDYDTVIKYLNQSSKISREIGDKSGEGETLYKISFIYKTIGDYENALKYLEKCLKIAEETGNKATEGIMLNNIGSIYIIRGDYDSAFKYLKQCLNIYHEVDDKFNEAGILINISHIYNSKGDFNTALKYLKKSLRIQKEIGNKAGERVTLDNLVNTAISKGDQDIAITYLEEILKITLEIGDQAGAGATMNNISQVYKSKGDYETALEYLRQSLRTMHEIGYESGIIAALHNIACIAYDRKNFEEFMDYEVYAYKIAIKINDDNGIYQVGNFLGRILYQMGQKKEGIEILKRSYQIGKKVKMPDVGEIEKFLIEIGEL